MTFDPDDFSLSYQTNLSIEGKPTDDQRQEMATLCAADLRPVVGVPADRRGAATCAPPRRGSSSSGRRSATSRHDGRYCFWAYGRDAGRDGTKLIMPSQNPDDLDTIPLYEQIYALCGLAQYYRITADWEVLEDIQPHRADVQRVLPRPGDPEQRVPRAGGYFSHLDYATMRPDVEALGKNQSRKNWNSNGDHIPAYLVNLDPGARPAAEGRAARTSGGSSTSA